MNCCVTDLRDKKVINSKNACVLGNVCDVEVDCQSGQVTALIIYGKSRCLGLMGRDEDCKIKWKDVEVIGEETILVCTDISAFPKPKKGGLFDNFFR